MKKTNRIRNLLSALLCLVMIAAIILTFTACNNSPDAVSSAPVSSAETKTEAIAVGEGNTKFTFTVVKADGSEKSYTVKTDSDTVGKALIDANLIAGEDGDYGLYVKTVDGTTLDFNTDGMYWAFYIDGEYASTGVDKTTITDGAVYSFKAEK